MKNYFVILMLASTISCAQPTEKKKIVVDYQGKALSEAEVQAFMKAEMDHFESLNTTTEVQVTKIDDLNAFPKWSDKGPSLRFRDLDSYNVSEKVVRPYLNKQISAKEFLAIIDTLKDDVRRSVPNLFTREYFPQLKTDRAVLAKVLEIEEKLLRGEESFLIRCTQQVDGFIKEIEDSIASKTFYTGEYSSYRGSFLARYAVKGDHTATLKLLAKAFEQMPVNENLNSSQGDFVSAFEYLMLHGDKSIRDRARQLTLQYLKKASFDAMGDLKALFSGEVADDLKQLIKAKRQDIDVLTDAEAKRKAEAQFKNYYLEIYARNFGAESFPLLRSLLSEKDNPYYVLPALRDIARYSTLSDAEKKEVVSMLQQVNQQRPGTYLGSCVTIMKYLYPEKKLADVTPLFNDENNELAELWNKKIYDAKNIEQYNEFLNGIGFDVSDVTKTERYSFLKQFESTNSEWMIYGMLNLAGRMVQYDCETGMWPNPYDELLQQYLDVCGEDLKGYFPVYFYEQIGEDETKYTALITDGKEGYVTNPRDAGDWYDPVSVEALVNRALKDKGVSKRFIQVETGDQTVATVYCTPGQLKLIADKFGIRILDRAE